MKEDERIENLDILFTPFFKAQTKSRMIDRDANGRSAGAIIVSYTRHHYLVIINIMN